MRKDPPCRKLELTCRIALEACTLSDLVEVDKGYLSRIQIRRDLILHHEQEVLQCNPVGAAAVKEIYEWFMSTYLPKRFPTMYKLSPTLDTEKASSSSQVLRNLVTGEDIPIDSPSDPKVALRIIGSHIDYDLMFLLPTASTTETPAYPGPAFNPASHPQFTSMNGSTTPMAPPPQEPRYHLHAFIGTFPSGFTWLDKISQPLSSIHGPVPGYSSKLERSMDRFFATLPPGKIVQRRNWSCMTNRELYRATGNHGDASEVTVAETMAQQFQETAGKEAGEEVDLKDIVMRAERQTLHRLPKTGALVFGFKTYQYELEEIKAEGRGEEFAQAIEGLWIGNVPKMVAYKKGNEWGKKVCEYLRS